MSAENLIQRLRDLGEYHELAADAISEIESLRFRVRELVASARIADTLIATFEATKAKHDEALDKIEAKSTGALCCFSFGGAREFVKEIQQIAREHTS
jgi:hypothetical protein